MNKELIEIVMTLASERRLRSDVVYEIVELALEAATRRQLALKDALVEIVMDRETGSYQTLILKPKNDESVEEYGNLKRIPEELMERETIDNVSFGRIATQTAKQTVFQKIREVEREQKVERMKTNLGKLYRGRIKRIALENILVECDEQIFPMPKTHTLPSDFFKAGDSLTGVLQEIEGKGKKPNYILSRTAPAMTHQLMIQEIPEIAEDIIQIKAIARAPGSRSKIAVKTNDRRIDPIGACVGMNGSRIQAISNSLGGEKIDVILWDDHTPTLIKNLFSSVNVSDILVDELSKKVSIEVEEEFLPIAIGKNGINVQLARQISGFDIDILSSGEMEKLKNKRDEEVLETLLESLVISKEDATLLLSAGFHDVAQIAEETQESLSEKLQDEEKAKILLESANQYLIDQELSDLLREDSDHQGLQSLEGMDETILLQLETEGIKSSEELAELSTDELVDIGVPKSLAESLIMEARKPWFE